MGKNEQKEKLNMSLAEKIYHERNKLGLSQEQFAEQMEISRQAVSKWETGQSMPDLDKLVMMSQIFGVSTDYLLKDEEESVEPMMETETFISTEETGTTYFEEEPVNDMTMEEKLQLSVEDVRDYEKVALKGSRRVALGVFLCIIGAAAGMLVELVCAQVLEASNKNLEISGNFVGLMILVFVTTAVGLFVSYGMQISKFDHLEKLPFTIPSSEKTRLTEDAKTYHNKFATAITCGVILVILGVIACVASDSIAVIIENEAVEEYLSPMLLLIFVAMGVYLFVSAGMKHGFYNVILQKEDYDIAKKTRKCKNDDLMGVVAGVYWCVITALFLGYSFVTGDWGRSWIVWPVAGCLFGAISIAITMRNNKNE